MMRGESPEEDEALRRAIREAQFRNIRAQQRRAVGNALTWLVIITLSAAATTVFWSWWAGR